jgi:hypothetical protein
VREKYRWQVANKPSELGPSSVAKKKKTEESE